MRHLLILTLALFSVTLSNAQNKTQLNEIDKELAYSISILQNKYEYCSEIKIQRRVLSVDVWLDKVPDYFVFYKIKYHYEGKEFSENFIKLFHALSKSFTPTNSLQIPFGYDNNSSIKLIKNQKSLFSFEIKYSNSYNILNIEYSSQQSSLYGNVNNTIQLKEIPDGIDWEMSDKIGDEITAGYFKYRVNSISFKKELGNPYYKISTTGYYLLLSISVINIDKESRNLVISMFKLQDDSGYKYDVSSEANGVLSTQNEKVIILNDLPPRIAKEFVIPFEVPTKIAFYELLMSGGFGRNIEGVVRLAKKGEL